MGSVGPQVVCFTNTNGKKLEQAAKHSLTAGMDYTMPLNADWNLISGFTAQYRSKRFQSPDNLIWIKSHWNVDAQAGVESDDYTVLAYVTNLLDNRNPVSAQTYGDPFIAPDAQHDDRDQRGRKVIGEVVAEQDQTDEAIGPRQQALGENGATVAGLSHGSQLIAVEAHQRRLGTREERG